MGYVDILLDLHWGDCGKGKIVDMISNEYDIIVRFGGGANSGHTICFNDEKFILNIMPSGIFGKDSINLIGNGVVIDPIQLVKEIDSLESIGIDVKKRLMISKRAHLVLPVHKMKDLKNESDKGKLKIGSTLKGIGPAYTDKIARRGIRVGDIFGNIEELSNNLTDFYYPDVIHNLNDEFLVACNKLKNYQIIDSEIFLNQQIKLGKKILAEGAQGTLLDIDFGTYPYVTSSNTQIGGVVTGTGIPPSKIRKVFGVFKAYTTRVGNGPFPTELDNEIGDKIRKIGNEWGATTGRPRRCGWLDLVSLKYSCMINGVTELFITKTDVLSELDTIKIAKEYVIDNKNTCEMPYDMNSITDCVYKVFSGWDQDLSNVTKYEDLPKNTKNYLDFIEKSLDIPITIVSLGPDRNQTIKK